MSDRSATRTARVPARGRRWLVLVAMAGSASMILLDQTVVAVALPALTGELDLSATGQQWVINAYGLAVASLVAVGGRLADRFGPVRVFGCGVLIFAFGSLMCSAAPASALGAGWIITARAVQGGGAALMIPVSATLVVNSFAVAVRGRAMALYGAISQIFLVAGPVIGGLLTQHVTWRAVFWLNPMIAVAIVLLLRIARPDNPRLPSSTLRCGPVTLLVGGLALTVLALQQASQWGPTAPVTIATLTAGAAVIVVFVHTQRRAATPLLDLQLLGQREFLGNVIVLGLFQFAVLAIVVYGSLYLQDLLGLTPSRAGVMIVAFVLPIMAAAQLGGWWYDRKGVRPPVLCGLATTVIGVLAWAAATWQRQQPMLLPGMILSGFGLGLVASPCYADALGRITPPRRGQASGVVQTVRQIGGILGVLTVGSVIISITKVDIRSAPPGLATDAVAAGFLVAAAVFAAAWGIGAAILPRSRVIDHPATAPPQATDPGQVTHRAQ